MISLMDQRQLKQLEFPSAETSPQNGHCQSRAHFPFMARPLRAHSAKQLAKLRALSSAQHSTGLASLVALAHSFSSMSACACTREIGAQCGVYRIPVESQWSKETVQQQQQYRVPSTVGPPTE